MTIIMYHSKMLQYDNSNKILHRCKKGSIAMYKLGYLKDSNAAAHSVDSDIFYAVIHLQLSCMMTHRWRRVTRDPSQSFG